MPLAFEASAVAVPTGFWGGVWLWGSGAWGNESFEGEGVAGGVACCCGAFCGPAAAGCGWFESGDCSVGWP